VDAYTWERGPTTELIDARVFKMTGQIHPGNRIAWLQMQPGARIITLPSGNRILVRDYIDGWKRLKIMVANPEIKAVGGFCDTPLSPQQTLKIISSGVHDRVNHCIPGYNKGRKWQSEYFWQCKRDQRLLQDNATQRRIIYRFETAECRVRFADRVTTPEEL
jgi:hypothetical protein